MARILSKTVEGAGGGGGATPRQRLALAAALLALAGIAVAAVLDSLRTRSEIAGGTSLVRRVTDALAAGDYARFHAEAAPSFREKVGEAAFVARMQEFERTHGRISDAEAREVPVAHRTDGAAAPPAARIILAGTARLGASGARVPASFEVERAGEAGEDAPFRVVRLSIRTSGGALELPAGAAPEEPGG